MIQWHVRAQEGDVFLLVLVPRSCFSMISALESGCLGVKNQEFGVRCITKTSFSKMLGFLLISVFCFHLGVDFNDFWCLGDTLET